MQFGVSCGRVSRVEFATEAEELGFDFCWVGDSPMLASNQTKPKYMSTRASRKLGIAKPKKPMKVKE